MTVDASLPMNGPARETAVRPWERGLLWLGAPLCAAGLATTGIAAQWRPGRFAELLILALASLGIAAALRRALRWPLANGLAVAWLLALVYFAGPVPFLAVVTFALAALALGALVHPGAPVALQTAGGLALCGGLLGWLLPLPVHYRAVYLIVCVALIAGRRRWLRDAASDAAARWRDAVATAPRPAAFAILALGLASTGAWLPTLQADDITYHLRLPWQLLEAHRYPLDPGLHIWSMAPWLGDVLQAVPQAMAGAEARGAVNLLWIAITAAGVWQLAVALHGAARAAWYSVALYACLPLTAALAGSMQTETPTAALLVWLAWMIVAARRRDPRFLALAAVLAGGLLGLKLAAALLALLLLPWALWRRGLPSLRAAVAVVAIVMAIGGSSYAYAGFVAHNPVLPLFNAWFHSPYAAPVNFDDPRWHAGFDALLPWNLTFRTERYLEAFAGGGGFVLVALAGAWLLALWRRETTAMAATTLLLVAGLLLPMQYLRYVFPALVLALPLLAVIAFRIDPRRAAWLLAGVCVLNLAFQANSFWLLRVGAVKMAVLSAGDDAPLFREYVPERNLIAAIRATPHHDVLALDPERPYIAELGVRGRSVSHLDRALQRGAVDADAVADGAAWAALLRREDISDLLVRPARLTPAQRAGLERLGAVQRGSEGDVQWWHLPAAEGLR